MKELFDLRAISLTQPWGWSMLHAGKGIENRTRSDGRLPDICRHRGPVLLHAAKGMKKADYLFARDFMVQAKLARKRDEFDDLGVVDSLPLIPERGELVRGAIIGRAVAVGYMCHNDLRRHAPLYVLDDKYVSEDQRETFIDALDLRWWMGGYALLLDDIKPTPVIPCCGHLGRWRVPGDVVAQLQWEEA
jgi:hypothetical protein